MIFAAGFGTRMGALTRSRPKALIEVGGRPLLDRALHVARAAGAAPIVVNAHYRAEQIADHLAALPDIRLSREAPGILETGGGLKAARPAMGAAAEAWTLNPDAVFTGPNPLATLAAAWRPGPMGALLLLVPLARAIGRVGGGDFAIDADGRLQRSPEGAVYTGAQIVSLDAACAVADAAFSMGRVWDALAREGRLFGVLHAGGWADVGRPEAIAPAEAMLRGRHAS